MKASDILFHVGTESSRADGDVLVVMCPKDFFEREGCVYDQHLRIHSLLPDWMAECQECLFDSRRGVDETRQALLDRGFVEDSVFASFCKDHDPFLLIEDP